MDKVLFAQMLKEIMCEMERDGLIEIDRRDEDEYERWEIRATVRGRVHMAKRTIDKEKEGRG